MLESLSAIGTFLAGIGAMSAVCTWKKQIRYKKRYEDIERLEITFKDYLFAFHSYYYVALEEMRNNNQISNFFELKSSKSKEVKEKWLIYNFAWKDAAYHLSSKQISSFETELEPHKLKSVLISLMPKRINEKNEDGSYKLEWKTEFEAEMNRILNEGIHKIKNFREKRWYQK